MHNRIACGILALALVSTFGSPVLAQSLSKRDSLDGAGRAIRSLAFSADGERLAVGDGYDSAAGSLGTLRVWDLEEKEVITLFESPAPVTAAAFTPNGRLAIWAGTVDLRAALMREHILFGKYDDGVAEFRDMVIARDGSHLVSPATGLNAGGAYVWNIDSRERVARIEGRYRSVALSPDGATLALGGRDGTVQLVNTSDWAKGKLLGKPVDESEVSVLAFSADGTQLFAWGGTAGGGVIYAVGGDGAVRLQGKIEKINDALFIGNTLVTAGVGIQLWDGQGAAQGEPLRDHTREVNCLALSPDGKTVASGGDWDQSVILWDAN